MSYEEKVMEMYMHAFNAARSGDEKYCHEFAVRAVQRFKQTFPKDTYYRIKQKTYEIVRMIPVGNNQVSFSILALEDIKVIIDLSNPDNEKFFSEVVIQKFRKHEIKSMILFQDKFIPDINRFTPDYCWFILESCEEIQEFCKEVGLPAIPQKQIIPEIYNN